MKAKFEISVVSGSMFAAMLTLVSVVAVPEHTVRNSARKHVAEAPGNSGGRLVTMASVTSMPLTLAGALRTHVQLVGHCTVPGSPGLPEF